MSLSLKMTHLPPGEQENRCQVFASEERAPCKYKSIEGTERCEMHGGNFYQQRNAKNGFRAYQLAQWDARLDHFHNADTIKSLREEVAISRMTMEGILLNCATNLDLVLYSSKISLMLNNIKDLVVSCNKLEDRLGLVLDKAAIINLAENIIQIIGDHVPEDKLSLVADKITEAVMASGRVPMEG